MITQIKQMKYFILIFVLVFSSLMMLAQTDVIYPEIGKTSIRNCSITKVTKGNIVHYVKDSVSSDIVAVAIRRNGDYIPLTDEVIDVSKKQFALYQGKTYDYYNEEYRKIIKNRNLGIGLTLCGLGAGIIGGLNMNRTGHNSNKVFKVLYFGGGILTNIGIIVWVSEGTHAANISKAMKKAKINFGGMT